jgi:hypothetical protein
MGDHGRRCVYEGSASHWREFHPESEALTLDNAILDAYNNATDDSGRGGPDDGTDRPERTYRVVGIFISGTNPPSDYKVHLVKHP